MENDPFKEYLRESEPDKVGKTYAWTTAIGLQAVDGLKPSSYLVDTAIRNIKGEITLKEARDLIDSYYKERPMSSSEEDRTEEADKVSSRIAEILSERAFTFSPNEYISIHRKLFLGIYPHAGKMRDYNITKKEWVLDGETVLFGSASELRATLEYDFSQEKSFSYRGLSMDEIIHHLAVFISRLWQIHIFGEGNTRTTAVFFIKYLRTLGFSANNDIFAENAWYFRNALVRANYNNFQKGIHETTEYLETFLRNLLLGEDTPLRNRTLHIKDILNSEKPDIQKMNNDIITGTAAKAADRYAMDVLGMASLELMETASRKAADYVMAHYPDREIKITVLCGTGNNGADGVCASCILLEAGYHPHVYLAGNMEKASWELLYQLFRFQQAGGAVTVYEKDTVLPNDDILIDGIFGIGLHREIAGIFRDLIREANRHRHAFVLAIDAPSGINTDTGALMGCGISADLTITFGRNKTGLVTGEGPAYAGKVLVEDIGIPDEAYEKV